MEVLEQAPPVARTRKKKLTYEDYVRLTPPDSGNHELHNGQIIVMPSPTTLHQDVVVEITTQMRVHAKKNKLGKVLTAPMDTKFTQHDIFQPDILFISNERQAIVGDKKIEGAPDLVVEVLSDSNSPQEMSYKKYIYETSEVREYWIVNLKKRTITIYRNIEGELMPKKIYGLDEVAESDVMAGFSIAVREIFETEGVEAG